MRRRELCALKFYQGCLLEVRKLNRAVQKQEVL